MAYTNMPLTELAATNAKPADRLVKISDGGGLQLGVFPDGAKRRRLAYRASGSQKVLAIGVYPEVGLKDAREARETAKKILAGGGDPMAVKKQAKAEQAIASANIFETIAAELVEKEAQRR
jgi:Arm DNA-binding domain